MLALLAHPTGEHQRMGEGALQFSLVPHMGRFLSMGSSFFHLGLRVECDPSSEPGIGRGVCSPANLTFGRRSKRLHQASAFGGRGSGERNQSEARSFRSMDEDGSFAWISRDRTDPGGWGARMSRSSLLHDSAFGGTVRLTNLEWTTG
jgi:hypothetical protein